MKHRAKLFQNGGSQAIRLPKECRFAGEREVLVHRDGQRVIVEPIDEWSEQFLSILGQWREPIERPQQPTLDELRDPLE